MHLSSCPKFYSRVSLCSIYQNCKLVQAHTFDQSTRIGSRQAMTSTEHHHSTEASAGASPEGPPVTAAASLDPAPKSMKEKILETFTSSVQTLKPINNFSKHICTWAMYSKDMNRKIETHHHASVISDDLIQCAVFDSADKHAKLIGVEYIISERMFKELPDEEKCLWHTHYYEVRHGLWTLPGLADMVAKPDLQFAAQTYGKFWLLWQADRGDKLPVGLPSLMMSPQDPPLGQIPHKEILRRDQEWNVNSESLFKSRTDIEPPPSGVDPMADLWKKENFGWGLELKKIPYGEQGVSGHVDTAKGETEGHTHGKAEKVGEHKGGHHSASAESKGFGGNIFDTTGGTEKESGTTETKVNPLSRNGRGRTCGEETHFSRQTQTTLAGTKDISLSGTGEDVEETCPLTHPSGCGTKKECPLVSPEAGDGSCRRGY